MKYSEPGIVSKDVSRDGRAPKEDQKETHPSALSKCDKNIDPADEPIVPRNLVFFEVDRPVRLRGCSTGVVAGKQRERQPRRATAPQGGSSRVGRSASSALLQC
jgi:hypothetical protein